MTPYKLSTEKPAAAALAARRRKISASAAEEDEEDAASSSKRRRSESSQDPSAIVEKIVVRKYNNERIESDVKVAGRGDPVDAKLVTSINLEEAIKEIEAASATVMTRLTEDLAAKEITQIKLQRLSAEAAGPLYRDAIKVVAPCADVSCFEGAMAQKKKAKASKLLIIFYTAIPRSSEDTYESNLNRLLPSKPIQSYSAATAPPDCPPYSGGRLLYRLDPVLLKKHDLPALVVSNSATLKTTIANHADHRAVRFNGPGDPPTTSTPIVVTKALAGYLKRRWQTVRRVESGDAPEVVAQGFYDTFDDPEIATVAVPTISPVADHRGVTKCSVGLNIETWPNGHRKSFDPKTKS